MKNKMKIALLSTACLLMAGPARAQNYGNGDLLLGFTGGANDFIYDLGQFSSLTLGETWNVGPGRGTKFGVVGAQSGGKHIYATSFDSAENSFDPLALYNTAAANVMTVSGQPIAVTVGTSRATSSGDTTGWTYQTAQAPGTPGNTFQNNFFNPNVDVGATAYFFDNANTGIVTPKNVFTYDSANGILTYSQVPEPAVGCLLLGGGLLIMSLRRQRLRRA